MKIDNQLTSIKKMCFIFLCLTICHVGAYSQTTPNDSIKLDYDKINSYCVQSNIKPILSLLDVDTNLLSKEDIAFKNTFENRFKYKVDRDTMANQTSNSIDSLLAIFKVYWRSSLLNPDQDYNSKLMGDLRTFFISNQGPINDSLNIDSCIQNFVSKEGYYALYGKVGKLHDLLIWQTQKDSIYTFSIRSEELSVKVVFLEDFITRGWVYYATVKESIGGWAESDALYCVKESYDIESDWFKIHYLAHEGKHFSDYKTFPNLSGYDLEYRAKLTELSVAQETLYELIEQFINISNYESENQHPLANYFVIKNLSTALFNSPFEDDMALWKSIDIETINNAAYILLQENTIALHNEGTEVENFIKNQPR